MLNLLFQSLCSVILFRLFIDLVYRRSVRNRISKPRIYGQAHETVRLKADFDLLALSLPGTQNLRATVTIQVVRTRRS